MSSNERILIWWRRAVNCDPVTGSSNFLSATTGWWRTEDKVRTICISDGAGGWWIIVNSRDFKSQREDETTVNKASWLKWSLPIVRQSDCWLSDRKTSQGCELWIVWMFESRGAMSAIFPGDLCVQTSVLAGDGYLIIVHVITNVAIAPGIRHSHHSINCDTNDMNNIGNVDTKLAVHVFRVWEENLLDDFLRGRKSKLINILALIDWALYARISE